MHNDAATDDGQGPLQANDAVEPLGRGGHTGHGRHTDAVKQEAHLLQSGPGTARGHIAATNEVGGHGRPVG